MAINKKKLLLHIKKVATNFLIFQNLFKRFWFCYFFHTRVFLLVLSYMYTLKTYFLFLFVYLEMSVRNFVKNCFGFMHQERKVNELSAHPQRSSLWFAVR